MVDRLITVNEVIHNGACYEGAMKFYKQNFGGETAVLSSKILEAGADAKYINLDGYGNGDGDGDGNGYGYGYGNGYGYGYGNGYGDGYGYGYGDGDGDGDGYGYGYGNGPGYDRGMNVHEVRGGLRYQFGNSNCTPPPAYEPTPEPVYTK